MGKYDFSDLGDQIMEQVQKAIESVDYKKLNEDISKTVGTAIDEVKKSLRVIQDGIQEGKKREDEHPYEYKEYKEVEQPSQGSGATSGYDEKKKKESAHTKKLDKEYASESVKTFPYSVGGKEASYPFPAKPIGRIASILMIVFGSIGLFSFSLPILICSIGWMMNELESLHYAVTLAVLIPFWIASVAVFGRGLFLNVRVSRFRKYIRRIGNKTVCSMEQLAKVVGKSDEFVVKDVRRMIQIGMFPEGHMDDEEKCLILDHKTYEYYLSSRQQLEKEREESENRQKDKEDPQLNELRLVMETGKNYVNQIRQVNEALPDPEISQKLDYMEKVIAQIFTCIEAHPEKLHDITKFLDYYMPTTIKLVQAYQNLEQELIQSDNIVSSKREIRQILDTINEAFHNLLDSLYHDMAMDISADISVLKTMLAQEGLTGNDFKDREQI